MRKPKQSAVRSVSTPNSTRRATVAGMGAAIAAATLPISASAQSKDIKVGFLLPLTGAFAGFSTNLGAGNLPIFSNSKNSSLDISSQLS